jgi:hypothetical protein
MYTPNMSGNEMESVTPEWYEPFPEPQPFPTGWDLSEVLAVSPAVSSENVAVTAEV